VENIFITAVFVFVTQPEIFGNTIAMTFWVELGLLVIAHFCVAKTYAEASYFC